MLTLIDKKKSTQNEPLGLDRRECRRNSKQGSISVATKGSVLASAPLIEYTTQGARVVINANVRPNQRVDFRLTTDNGHLDGYARIAWTSPLSNGRHVAGLEFIDFTMTTRRIRQALDSKSA